jgi:hypothetical protein
MVSESPALILNGGSVSLKRLLYSSAAILCVIGFIVYGFLSAPKVIHVNRQIEATAYKLDDSQFAKPVLISLEGVFDEKSESYLGKMTVNGKEFTDCSLGTKFNIMNCTDAEDESPLRDLVGMIYASKDYREWVINVESSYNVGRTENSLYTIMNEGSSTTDNILLSIPAADRDSTLRIYYRLR